MNKLLVPGFLFLVTCVVVMAAPAPFPRNGDWVDRMAAGHSHELTVSVAAVHRLASRDWVDRMIVQQAQAGQPRDWVDRMIASRSRDFISAFAQAGLATPVPRPAGTLKATAGLP